MMIRTELIQTVGMMDESYFLYYEEMDWCEKIKRKGYQIWLEPNALIYHKESVSVGSGTVLKEYYMTRNRIRFIMNNAPAISRLIFLCYFFLFVSFRNNLSYLIKGRFDLMKAFWKGALNGVGNQRLQNQSKKSV